MQPIPSRRQILAALAGTSGAMLLAPRSLYAAAPDPRVAQIVARTIAVDMHSHVLIPYVKNPADAKPDLDVDLAGEIKRAGFSVVCETFNIDAIVSKEPGFYNSNYQQAMAYEDRLLARNHMRRALTMKDIETAHTQHQPIIIQSAEGAQFLEGRLERIEESYKRGLRHMQFLHEQDDTVAPMGDVYTAPAEHLGGLTPFGAQVIRECNRLGMVVDLAHGTSSTVLAALKVATQPMLVSHTGLIPQAEQANADMQRRLIATDVARAVADAGGVVGVWWRLADSVKDYVTGIKRMADAIGVDHVGIGTDTNITSSNSLPYTNKIWPDQNAGFFYAVAAEMLKQGFHPEEISKVGGGNFCRVFAKVTASNV